MTTREDVPAGPWYDDVVLPALLRGARDTFGRAVRAELAAAELDDMPRNGAFVLGGMANRGGSLADLTTALGVSKQAASQLADTLVNRGYLARRPDTEDRRRMTIELTERGRFAAAQVRAAVEKVDAALAGRLSGAELATLRAGLGALIEIGSPRARRSTAEPGPNRFARFAPIFPVRVLSEALSHYAGLGFAVSAYRDGDEYGFVDRSGVSLHLAATPELDPKVGASACYLYVADADELAREWSREGIGGRTIAPSDTPYGLREGAHLDPDNNLIRFGSPIPDQSRGR